MSGDDGKNHDYQKAIQNVVHHLKCKRSELQDDIKCDEIEKAKLVGQMNQIQDRISILNVNLKKKTEFSKEYDKAITESEQNFVQLLQKSEDFLNLTKRGAMALSHAVCDPNTVCKSTPKLVPSRENVCDGPPNAILTVAQGDALGNCVSCSGGSACATLVIPYRANGL